MAKWTRLLDAKEIINGRLIMVESQMACHYRYLIFPDEKQSFDGEIIKSSFSYSSWKAAMSAGKKLLLN